MDLLGHRILLSNQQHLVPGAPKTPVDTEDPGNRYEEPNYDLKKDSETQLYTTKQTQVPVARVTPVVCYLRLKLRKIRKPK